MKALVYTFIAAAAIAIIMAVYFASKTFNINLQLVFGCFNVACLIINFILFMRYAIIVINDLLEKGEEDR